MRYLVSMGVRTACFLLAVVVHGPLRWVFVLAAIVLPYIAVVFANAGRERSLPSPPEIFLRADRTELPSASDGARKPPEQAPSEGPMIGPIITPMPQIDIALARSCSV